MAIKGVWRSAALGLAAVGLAACVSSETPLIGPDEVVFPFESILLEADGGDWVVIERLGDGYVQTYGTVPSRYTAPHGRVFYRFAAIDDEHFLLQASGVLDGNRFLYAVARIDPGSGNVVIIADGTPFEGDGGLRKCSEQSSEFCVVDLHAFALGASSTVSYDPQRSFTYRILRTRGAAGSWSRGEEASPTLVEAFLMASSTLTPRQEAVVDGMSAETTLESLVATGRIETPYDCLPEHRSLCHEVLSQRTGGDTIIYEWGEWLDNFGEDQTAAFVTELMNEAAALGFNLLTNQELARATANAGLP